MLNKEKLEEIALRGQEELEHLKQQRDHLRKKGDLKAAALIEQLMEYKIHQLVDNQMREVMGALGLPPSSKMELMLGVVTAIQDELEKVRTRNLAKGHMVFTGAKIDGNIEIAYRMSKTPETSEEAEKLLESLLNVAQSIVDRDDDCGLMRVIDDGNGKITLVMKYG